MTGPNGVQMDKLIRKGRGPLASQQGILNTCLKQWDCRESDNSFFVLNVKIKGCKQLKKSSSGPGSVKQHEDVFTCAVRRENTLESIHQLELFHYLKIPIPVHLHILTHMHTHTRVVLSSMA